MLPHKSISRILHNFAFMITVSMTTVSMTTALTAVLVTAAPLAACDVCLRLPGVPFKFERLASIEVAAATQAAIAAGELELNPTLKRIAGNDSGQSQLAEVSARQLLGLWSRTRPAKRISATRITLDVVFVDVDRTNRLDVRLGEVTEGDPQSGPADLRLITTRAGFYHLLTTGFDSCQQRQLAVVEAEVAADVETLRRLFPVPSQPDEPLPVVHVKGDHKRGEMDVATAR